MNLCPRFSSPMVVSSGCLGFACTTDTPSERVHFSKFAPASEIQHGLSPIRILRLVCCAEVLDGEQKERFQPHRVV